MCLREYIYIYIYIYIFCSLTETRNDAFGVVLECLRKLGDCIPPHDRAIAPSSDVHL